LVEGVSAGTPTSSPSPSSTALGIASSSTASVAGSREINDMDTIAFSLSSVMSAESAIQIPVAIVFEIGFSFWLIVVSNSWFKVGSEALPLSTEPKIGISSSTHHVVNTIGFRSGR